MNSIFIKQQLCTSSRLSPGATAVNMSISEAYEGEGQIAGIANRRTKHGDFS